MQGLILLLGIIATAVPDPADGINDSARPPEMIIIEASERGILPDTGDNSGPALKSLIGEFADTEEPVLLQLERGVYHIDGPDAHHAALVIDNARNLTIRGRGTKTSIIFRDPTLGGFFVAEGTNVWIEDLSIDYDPAPFTQGTILLPNRSAGWFDFAIQSGYPLLSEPWFSEAPKPYGQWGMIFDRRKPRIKAGAADFIFLERWEQISRRVWRIYPVEEQRERLQDMQPGDRWVHLARHGKGGSVFFWRSRESGVRNVTVYASQSLALGAVSCDRITVQGLTVINKPGTDRLISANADGVHVQQNLRGPIIENCRFENMADDGINIYYPPNAVTAVISETVLRTEQGGIIEVGDELHIFDPEEGRVLGEALVREVRPNPGGGYRLTLDRPLHNVPVGPARYALYNMTRCGADFEIRNNTFRNHRRHGMMIKAPHGIIEDNVIESIGGLGIIVGNDPEWPEGVIPFDLLIRNNRIQHVGWSRWYGTNSRGAAMQFMTLANRGRLAADRRVQAVTLENNVVIDPPGAALYIGAAHDIFVSGLYVSYLEDHTLPRTTSAILLENVSQVRMEQIHIDTPQTALDSGVLIMESSAPGLEGVAVTDIHLLSPAEMEPVRDMRQ